MHARARRPDVARYLYAMYIYVCIRIYVYVYYSCSAGALQHGRVSTSKEYSPGGEWGGGQRRSRRDALPRVPAHPFHLPGRRLRKALRYFLKLEYIHVCIISAFLFHESAAAVKFIVRQAEEIGLPYELIEVLHAEC